MHANATGLIAHNLIASTGINADAAIVAAMCEWFENYAVEADGETASLIGVNSDDPTNWIGRNSADNDANTAAVTDNKDGSVLERLEDITQELSGGDGLVAFPGGVAAANAVSLAEVLRFTQENVIVGAGTALPADHSLWGALAGATGIGAWPGAAVAAANVSLAEVLQYVQESGVGAQADAAVQIAGAASVQSYLKGLIDVLWAAGGVDAFPAAAVAGNDVSLAAVLRYVLENSAGVQADAAVQIAGAASLQSYMKGLIDVLWAAGGIDAFPAAAVAGNDVSLAAVLRYIQENSTGAQADAAVQVAGAASAQSYLKGILDILYGATGIAAFPGAAVAANDVSLAEVLRYVQENGVGAQGDAAVQVAGAASAQAYLKGLLDVLYAAGGITTWPAGARAANDVSIAESLRYSQEVQEQCVAKLDGACLAVADPIFDVAGGPVIVTAFLGVVTDTIGANPANCQIAFTPTAPGVLVTLSTDVAITDDAIGTTYTVTAATPGVFTPTTNGCLDQLPANQWVLPIGQMIADTDAANTGVIEWYLFYKPMSPLSVVTAAA